MKRTTVVCPDGGSVLERTGSEVETIVFKKCERCISVEASKPEEE